jgi:hypothetical protein
MAKLPNEFLRPTANAIEALINRGFAGAKSLFIPKKLLLEKSTVSEFAKLEEATFKSGRRAQLNAGETRIIKQTTGPISKGIIEARPTETGRTQLDETIRAEFDSKAEIIESRVAPLHTTSIQHVEELPFFTNRAKRIKPRLDSSEQLGITEAITTKTGNPQLEGTNLPKLASDKLDFHTSPLPDSIQYVDEVPHFSRRAKHVKVNPGSSEQNGITERDLTPSERSNSSSLPTIAEGPAGMSQKQIKELQESSKWRDFVEKSFNPSVDRGK